jgi:division protein CdvB (Snf7/Vps24/ESCRT-III family)
MYLIKIDKMDSFNISDQEYKQIEKAISSEESVVGIDAKKTHIIILHLLKKMEERLENIESRLDDLDK